MGDLGLSLFRSDLEYFIAYTFVPHFFVSYYLVLCNIHEKNLKEHFGEICFFVFFKKNHTSLTTCENRRNKVHMGKFTACVLSNSTICNMSWINNPLNLDELLMSTFCFLLMAKSFGIDFSLAPNKFISCFGCQYFISQSVR